MQPDWSTQPDPAARTNALRVVRTPPTGLIRAWVTAFRAVVIQTHWRNGRTGPHMIPTCQACDEGLPFRWHSYLPLWLPAPAQHVLWQGTEDTWHTSEAFYAQHNSLRGALATIKRASKSPRSMVLLTLSRQIDPPTDLPPPPDVLTILDRMWGFKAIAGSQASHDPWPTNSRTE